MNKNLSPSGTKYCSCCYRTRAVEHFSKNRTRWDGLAHYCKECALKTLRRRREFLPQQRRAEFLGHIWRQFRIRADQWDALLIAQSGRCATCLDYLHRGQNLHVDHCHKTTKVRGLLCQACNTTLGKMKEDPIRLQALIEYLRLHGAVPLR